MGRYFSYVFRVNRFRNLIRRFIIDLLVYSRYITFRKVLNYLRNFWELKLRRITLKSLPPRVYIETTNYCNLRCPYCVSITRPMNPKGLMSDEMFHSIIQQLKPYLIFTRLYNQGDPFVDKFLLNRLAVLKDNNISSILVTNFSMPLKDDYIKKIVALQPEHIVICFESLTNEVYKKYRIGGDVHILKANIKTLVTEKKKQGGIFPLISFRVLITKYNEHELEEIYHYYQEAQVNNILFVPMYVNKDDEKAVEEWLPTTHYYESSFSEIFCSELWNNPVINFEGNVVPCCAIYNYKENFGSLENFSFSEIWNSKQYCDARKIFTKNGNLVTTDKTNICIRCRGKLKTGSNSGIER